MKTLGSSTTTCLLILGAVILAASASAQTRAPIFDQIAKTYGLDSYDKIDAIRYTFALDVPGLFSVTRSWEWHPKTGEVTFDGKGKDGKPVKVTYNRNQLSSQSADVKTDIDPGFINDNYWLIFPFHAYWDKSATITDDGMQKLPTGTGTARRVVVKYPSESGGYSPGDTWELFVGSDNRIQAMRFHHGGSVKPSLVIATWTGYKKAGPLLVSTDHRGTADGKPLKLLLQNVAVKLAGSDTWLKAQ